MTDKEFVQAHWADGLDPNYTDDHQFFYVRDIGINFDSWAAAAEFTRDRLEEIRQVEREIGFIERQLAVQPHYDDMVGPWSAEDVRNSARNVATWSRILAREHASLAALMRGIKEK